MAQASQFKEQEPEPESGARHVRWEENMIEPAESLSLRREALNRLEFVLEGSSAVPSKRDRWGAGQAKMSSGRSTLTDLPQSEKSLRRCLALARFVPAQSLYSLQQRLYSIHVGSRRCRANPWQPLIPPVVIDVTKLYNSLGFEYRWWHVQMNYVLSFSTMFANSEERRGGLHRPAGSKDFPYPLNLRDFIETLISVSGANHIVESTTFDLSLIERAIIPVGLLRPDLVPLPASNAPERFFMGCLWPSADALPHCSKRVQVPLIRILDHELWRKCLQALARGNSDNDLLQELVAQEVQYF